MTDTASVGTPDAYYTPFTQPTTPTTPGDLSFPSHFTDNSSLFQSKPILCKECHILTCQPGQTLCMRCVSLSSNLSSPASNTFSDGVLDPFRSFPVEVDASVSELLSHFLSVMSPGAIAVDIRHQSDLIRTDWFGTALSNRGFMHSLLCAAALHLYIVGKGSYFSIEYHKSQAVTAINEALSDANLGIADANIGAVFNLLCVEESLLLPFFQHRLYSSDEDQPNQRMIHLNGLKRMVELRGGLGAIKTNRCLQAFILWHSTAHAIASFDPPYLSPLDDQGEGYNHLNAPAYQPAISKLYLVNLCRKANVKDSLVKITEDLLSYASDLNAWFNDSGCPLDPLEIQNHASLLECCLLRCLQSNGDTEALQTPVEDSLCIAFLIFVVRASEMVDQQSERHHVHFTASKRLQEALNATSFDDWSACPDLLLWVLTIGSIVAQGAQEYDWWVFQTATTTMQFGIDSLSSLLERLHHCVWVGYKLDRAAERLWDHISHRRLEPPPTTTIRTTYTSGPLQFQVSELDYELWQSKRWFPAQGQPIIPQSLYLPTGAPIWGEDGSGLYDTGLFHGRAISTASPQYPRPSAGFRWLYGD